MVEELFSSLLIVVAVLAAMVIFYFLSKIPGAGLIGTAIRGIFIILWNIVVFFLMFFMYFMVGFTVVVIFTFYTSPEGILFQGEPFNFLIGDHTKYAAYFTAVYAGFCLVIMYILTFIFVFGRKIPKRVGKFQPEVSLAVILGLVLTVFPSILSLILPDFELGIQARFALGFLPIAMYVQEQIKRARDRRKYGGYLSGKERFYLNMDKKKSKSSS